MQKRNTYTQIEDFLSDESFQSWILFKIDENGWEEWTLESRQRAKLVQDARLLLLAMKVPESDLSSSDIHSALQEVWRKIEEKENQSNSDENSKIFFLRKYFLTGVAASLLLCLMSVWFYNNHFKTDNIVTYKELIDENDEGLVEQTNNSTKPQIITLSDGSSVLLQPNSKLSYPKIFTGNERKVYLSGEGFFEISKNPRKPFYVYANEIVTKVVGTSFRIKAYSDQPDVEVLVRTGKVKVKSNDLIAKSDQQEVVLLPNQALRFLRSDLKFNKITNITQDVTLVKSVGNIEQLSFEFTDIPVSQIFETIEQAYLVDIDYPKNKLKDCHLTTSLSDQPLTEKLRIVCKSIGTNTNFEMNGNQITITSEGCN
jgi:transmembrane sensor